LTEVPDSFFDDHHQHMSFKEGVLAISPAFVLISTAVRAAGTLCILCCAFGDLRLSLRGRTTNTNMVLLVAGLRGVDSFELYHFGGLADRRKHIRSVTPITFVHHLRTLDLNCPSLLPCT